MGVTKLKELFVADTGEKPEEVVKLAGAGSDRHYFRLRSMHFSRIGVCGTSREENEAFVYLSGHFRQKGIPVPEVFGVSPDGLNYLQEDLGEVSLFDALKGGREKGVWGPGEFRLLEETMEWLPFVQFRGGEGLDFNRCYPQPVFDQRSVFWDLNYFKYCFLKPSGIDFREDRLEEDFGRVAEVLLRDPSETFMYRDFQSRNVMIREGKPYFIDFQGGRKGPFYYDVASFLWQARARYPEEVRESLLEVYWQAVRPFRPVEAGVFRERLRHFVLFRLLQVLGAYGFRGYFEKKAPFIQCVPAAVESLRSLLKEGFCEYPYLSRMLEDLTGCGKYTEPVVLPGLTVHVYSFSYRKGIPEDSSGNGGGYVFDCRAIHNPGRYEAYKKYTGLDEPVIRFLETDGEITVFLESVYRLVGASVRRYQERGFGSLTVCFGCTGGQHRSVYAAQHLAGYLNREFGVRVHLVHREQGIEQILDTSNKGKE